MCFGGKVAGYVTPGRGDLGYSWGILGAAP